MVPSLFYDSGLELGSVRAALVWSMGMPGCPKTVSVPAFVHKLLNQVRAEGENFIPAARRAAVRGMLRYGTYKPSGRSKPSSEYLLAAALRGDFPLVNGPVDVNNAVSLEWGYPASIFDMEISGRELMLRRGSAEESYVFNPSGQSIDLEDLLCTCRMKGGLWTPCGNPVKDAMATKVRESTCSIAAVIYAPATEPKTDLAAAATRFAALLSSECKAAETGWSLPQEFR